MLTPLKLPASVPQVSPSPATRRRLERCSQGCRQIGFAVVVSCLVLIAAVACGDDDSEAATDRGASINVTLGDGTIDLDSASSSEAEVHFAIENTGELAHEFVVLKTDLAEDELPLTDDESAVDEAASGLSVVATREDISPGSSTELEADDLEAGNYVFICNVPGHYSLGMHTSFTVE